MNGVAPRAGRRVESTPVHISGAALLFVGIGMAMSAGVALIDGGGGALALAVSAVITISAGSIMMGSTTASDRSDSPLAFAAVAWAWLAVSIAGTMPYLFSGVIRWSEADNALFESISGFTCTGATILADIDGVAHGILFFRSMTQWFGGMGLIVLAVSVLPALKVGGLELIANEAPGPTADRFTPRIAATARRLWLLYGGFTLAMALGLLAAGLSLFDAVAHAFTTVATGGFSTYSASIAAFDSVAVETVVIVGMITCGASFSIHWHLITRTRSQRRSYSELRWYLGLIVGAALALLMLNSGTLSIGDNVREAAFYAASLGSNTGYGLTDYTHSQFLDPIRAARAARAVRDRRYDRLDGRRHQGPATADHGPVRVPRGDPRPPPQGRAADAPRRHHRARGHCGAGLGLRPAVSGLGPRRRRV